MFRLSGPSNGLIIARKHSILDLKYEIQYLYSDFIKHLHYFNRFTFSVMMTLLVSWSVQGSGLKLFRSRIQV